MKSGQFQSHRPLQAAVEAGRHQLAQELFQELVVLT